MVVLTGARGQAVAAEILLKSMSLAQLASLIIAAEDAAEGREVQETVLSAPETLTIRVAA